MRTFLLLTTTVLLTLSSGPQDAVKKDMAQLEGEWSMVSGEIDGQPMPAEMLKDSKRVSKDGETTVTIAGQLFMKAKYTIDPAKKPKTIDYMMTDGFTKGKTHWAFMSWTRTR